MKKIFLLTLLYICFSHFCLADSPLTTTDFAGVYKNIPIVQQALKSEEHVLTPSMLEYIANKNNPVDVKLSIINALGFGLDNGSRLARYLESKYKVEGNDLYPHADASELITLAYAYSRDNYFDLDKALIPAHYAQLKAPKSMSVKLIISLMDAQLALNFDWQQVYQVVNKVVTDNTLDQDINPLCIKSIMEYIGEYKDEI